MGMYGLRAVAPLLSRGGSKLARGVRGRREAWRRLVAWGRTHRDPDRPLVWFHAPSVGEGLQARAVLEAFQVRCPEAQAVFTHFSPSAESLAARMPVDVADYLPWDVAREVGPVLDALAPDLVAFSKTEVWPVLVREARRRGVPCVLVAATLPEGSSRRRWPARRILAPTLDGLAGVFAIAPDDRARFVALGAREERTAVTGDPAIDSAARRAGAADPDAAHLRPFRHPERPTLVAGSTWPPDEAVLVPACTALRRRHPTLRLLVAPHEPDASHLAPLEAALTRAGWRTARLGEVEASGRSGEADAVVVDRVGVLAHLYTVGVAAYVGGGFHGQGLHSVLEPAAAGLPVVFGPRHHNARAAGELVEAGGARVAGDALELEHVLRGWLDDPDSRSGSAVAAAGYIEAHRGAAARTADHLRALLS